MPFPSSNKKALLLTSVLPVTLSSIVSGAKDAATGFGSVKYANIAGAKAFEDMVNTVEETVNRSSKAMIAKDRRRQKRTDKSFRKYGRWHNRRDWSDSRDHMITTDHGHQGRSRG